MAYCDLIPKNVKVGDCVWVRYIRTPKPLPWQHVKITRITSEGNLWAEPLRGIITTDCWEFSDNPPLSMKEFKELYASALQKLDTLEVKDLSRFVYEF